MTIMGIQMQKVRCSGTTVFFVNGMKFFNIFHSLSLNSLIENALSVNLSIHHQVGRSNIDSHFDNF